MTDLDAYDVGRAVGAALRTVQQRSARAERLDPATLTLESLLKEANQKQRSLASLATETDVQLTLPVLQVVLAQADPEPEDAFYVEARRTMGFSEEHPNALYLVLTLAHTDRVVQNAGNDLLPRAEVEKALATLIGQPIDVASEMDRHERERLSWWNGIRGFIYAARLVGDAIECGVVLWAIDFPDIAEKVANFRDSLGGSFDLLASGFEIERAKEPGGRDVRKLSGITFLGGTIISKYRAADADTSMKDLRYRGRTIEAIEEEQRMAEVSNEQGQAAAPVVPVTAAAPVVPTAPVVPAGGESAVVSALAEAQHRVASLQAQVERLTLEVSNKEAELSLRSEEAVALTARAEQAEAALAAQAAALAAEERVETRMAALAAQEAALKEKGLEVTLFADDAAREAARAAVRDLSDEAFSLYVLTAENTMLTTAKLGAAPKPVASQAAGQPGAFSSLNGGATDDSLAGLGRSLSDLRRGR